MHKINVLKLYGYFISLIIFIISIYTLYKSEIVSQGYYRINYYINYITIIALIIFQIIYFKSKENDKKNLLLLLHSIFFIALIIEIYLFINLDKKKLIKNKEILGKKIKIFKERYNKAYDIRSKYEVYKNKKPEYILNITPSFYLDKNNSFFPLSGISNSKIINCNENGYYSEFESDEYGFNNFLKKWPTKIDYFLIGDSFLNGSCVNEKDTFTYNLLNNFNFKKKIINVGMAGNGPLIEYASYKEFSKKRKIKNLILFYYEGNDMGNFYKELKNPLLRKYFDNEKFSQNLIEKQNFVDQLHQKTFFEKENSFQTVRHNIEGGNKSLKNLLKFTNLRSLLNNFLFKHQGIFLESEFNELIIKLKENTKINDIKLYFVYIPEYYRFKEKNFQNEKYFYYGKIKKILKKNDIYLIDLIEEINRRKIDPLLLYPFGESGHFNEYGYKMISEIIYGKLIE